MEKKRFKLATLGCRTNQYETQAYRDQLLGMGYVEAGEGEEADLCIVNTCTVTESADRSSRAQIRKLAKHNPGAEVVVTGCLSDRVEVTGSVTRVVPNKQKEQLVAELFPDQDVPEFSIKNFEAHTRAFVKVQDGCNSYCTYCIIPYVRGRSRCRPIAEVLKEIEDLVASGYKDIVITGINVGDYDDEGKGLAELMRAADQVPGVKRLRLSSIDPDEVDDNLMDAVLNGKNTCHSFHIVLQSGSNVVLKRMNRKYTRQMFFETIEKLRAAAPDFTFTTDVIVGFPGETEADFEETLDVMRQTQFAKVHMFPYSRRERTRAALYPNQVAPDVINARKARVLEVAEQTAYELREKYVGQTMSVLVEDGASGHTENFLSVVLPKGKYQPNDLIEVKLIANSAQGLVAADA